MQWRITWRRRFRYRRPGRSGSDCGEEETFLMLRAADVRRRRGPAPSNFEGRAIADADSPKGRKVAVVNQLWQTLLSERGCSWPVTHVRHRLWERSCFSRTPLPCVTNQPVDMFVRHLPAGLLLLRQQPLLYAPFGLFLLRRIQWTRGGLCPCQSTRAFSVRMPILYEWRRGQAFVLFCPLAVTHL